eukprot:Sdes_comp9023_c0_seq1m446
MFASTFRRRFLDHRRKLSSVAKPSLDYYCTNGRKYFKNQQPIVVLCIDGLDPSYIEHGVSTGLMPHWKGIWEAFAPNWWTLRHLPAYFPASGVMPSFTNPNNMAIVTGCRSDITGICGNYFLDRRGGDVEVMMNDPKYLKCDTIFQHHLKQGMDVVVITAKDKLLRLLSHGIDAPDFCGSKAIYFSIEKALDPPCQQNLKRHGFRDYSSLMDGHSPPSIYDPEISLAAVQAGIQILKKSKPQLRHPLVYISTTDYVQHKYPPGSPVSNHFLQRLDSLVGELHQMGCRVGVTADHGMSDKPNILYISSILKQARISCRVVLPITDPYVKHHGALGGFCTVYIHDKSQIRDAMKALSRYAHRGIDAILSRSDACKRYHLPHDRIGDIVVASKANTALGLTESEHDLTALDGFPLRSHGGVFETRVPFWMNVPLSEEYLESAFHQYHQAPSSPIFHNFDIFEILMHSGASEDFYGPN